MTWSGDLKRGHLAATFFLVQKFCWGRKGRRVSEVVRALTSQECGLGLIPARYFMRVEFVAGFRFAPAVFLLILRFSSLHKRTQHSKLQFDQDRGPAWKPAKTYVALFLTLFIHLFFYLLYLFIHSFIYLFIYLFIHLFIHLFIYLLIYVAGTTQNGAWNSAGLNSDKMTPFVIVGPRALPANCPCHNKEMNQYCLRVHQFA